jgi:predicted DNA-binding transcriptional regulator AlpA
MGGKRRTALDQLELFGGSFEAGPVASPIVRKADAPSPVIKPAPARSAEVRAPAQVTRAPPEKATPADEWWTTKMVCGFLKISRKTLWERRRKTTLHFPRPVNLGGGRNVYRASEVRHWAEAKALAGLCELE